MSGILINCGIFYSCLMKKLKNGRKQADHWFSLIIRAKGKCDNCKSTFSLQCAHICSRRYLNLRWDVRNAVCLCAKCHVYYTYRPIEWNIWVNKRIGEKVHDGLKKEALKIRVGKIMYKELIDSLKAQYKNL